VQAQLSRTKRNRAVEHRQIACSVVVRSYQAAVAVCCDYAMIHQNRIPTNACKFVLQHRRHWQHCASKLRLSLCCQKKNWLNETNHTQAKYAQKQDALISTFDCAAAFASGIDIDDGAELRHCWDDRTNTTSSDGAKRLTNVECRMSITKRRIRRLCVSSKIDTPVHGKKTINSASKQNTQWIDNQHAIERGKPDRRDASATQFVDCLFCNETTTNVCEYA
jgi:hypothetical protein